MTKTIKKIREEAPTVSAGSGEIAGIGVGPKGEPGVDNRKLKYKKDNEKKTAVIFGMLRRKLKGQLEEEVSNFGYSLLMEAPLNPEQKALVDSWGTTDTAERISKHVIPPRQHRVTFPIEEAGQVTQPHPDVVAHLDQHGYQVSDYRAGLAETKDKKRKMKIGKILSMTNADKKLKQTFENDPARAASRVENKSRMMVTVSRHPHDIANMSTNQGWTSCMDMEEGCNAHYLKNDVQKGTHVAYLHSEDDQNLENPIARIALKPFHEKNRNHTILRPESVAYGTSDNKFGEAVNKWTENNFPAQRGGVYEKDWDVYHDGGSRYAGNPDDLMRHEDANVVRDTLTNRRDLSSGHIDMAMEHPDPYVAQAALFHHKNMINDGHIESAVSRKHPIILGAIARQHMDKIKPEHVDTFINNEPVSAREIFKERPELINGGHIRNAMMNTNNSSLRNTVYSNFGNRIKSDYVTDAIRNPRDIAGQSAFDAIGNTPIKKLTSEHLSAALEHPLSRVASYMMVKLKDASAEERKNLLQPHHIDKMMSHPDSAVASDALDAFGNEIEPRHIDMAFETGNPKVTRDALSQEHEDKIEPRHIDAAFQQVINAGKKSKAHHDAIANILHSPKLSSMITPEHYDMIMNHPNFNSNSSLVLKVLSDHKDRLLDRHFKAALEHPDPYVGSYVFNKHPEKIGPDEINKALDREDDLGAAVFNYLGNNADHKHKISWEMMKKGASHLIPKVSTAASYFARDNNIQLYEQTTFAGKQVFVVPSQIFNEMKLQKRKGKHWSSYIKEDDYMQPIREYANNNPKKPIIIQCENTGAMMYARYPKS